MAPSHSSTQVTGLLSEARAGNEQSQSELTSLLYEELRRLASGCLRRERPNHTLQATALVHEVYLRLVGQDRQRVTFSDRAHFLATAAHLMREILVDHARRKRTQKRGKGLQITLSEDIALSSAPPIELMDVDAALNRLAQLDSTQAKIVELRFFGGLSIEESACTLAVSPSTVKRDWVLAKAWLYRELSRKDLRQAKSA